MKAYPVKTQTPPNSRAALLVGGASFSDSWSISSSDCEQSALAYLIAALKHTPRWIDMCMKARNRVGRLAGLKDLGTLSDVQVDKQASDYKPGDRVGIFTVFENAFDEAIVGDDDKHLHVSLSIYREKQPEGLLVTVTVTTIVHVKNMLGIIYMLPVKPMHRLIAPTVLAALGESNNVT